MDGEKDLVSAIIPTYNRREMAWEAIDSVLCQKGVRKEIIIVDDGSEDGTTDMLKKRYGTWINKKLSGANTTRVILLENERNFGHSYSRRRGYEASSGEYVIFVDDDDFYTNMNFFAHAVEIFKKYPTVGMVMSQFDKEQDGKIVCRNMYYIKGLVNGTKYLEGRDAKYMAAKFSGGGPFSMHRRKTLNEANFQDVEFVDDVILHRRALLAGDAYGLDEESGVYRVHTGSKIGRLGHLSGKVDTDYVLNILNETKKVADEVDKRKLFARPKEWLRDHMRARFFTDLASERGFERGIEWCRSAFDDKMAEEVIADLRKKREQSLG